MSSADIRHILTEQLEQEHCFWSMRPQSVHDIPDDILIEKVLVYLDLADIDKLFTIFSPRKVKEVWLHHLVPQEEYYHNLNRFLAWWYFGIKQPDTYLKRMVTRHLNRIAS